MENDEKPYFRGGKKKKEEAEAWNEKRHFMTVT
jgi:hypothetical protein